MSNAKDKNKRQLSLFDVLKKNKKSLISVESGLDQPQPDEPYQTSAIAVQVRKPIYLILFYCKKETMDCRRLAKLGATNRYWAIVSVDRAGCIQIIQPSFLPLSMHVVRI
jgi:hypothetical protein